MLWPSVGPLAAGRSLVPVPEIGDAQTPVDARDFDVHVVGPKFRVGEDGAGQELGLVRPRRGVDERGREGRVRLDVLVDPPRLPRRREALRFPPYVARVRAGLGFRVGHDAGAGDADLGAVELRALGPAALVGLGCLTVRQVLQAGHGLGEREFLVREEGGRPEGVAVVGLLVELGVDRLLQVGQQALLVDEGQQSDPEPGHGLAVGVNFHLLRVEVGDGRVLPQHELVAWLGQRVVGLLGQHGHELLHGLEGLRVLPPPAVLLHVPQVRREGRVVKGEVPLPARAPLVVVLHDPTQAPDVLFEDPFAPPALGDVLGLVLVGVVAVLPSGLPEADLVADLLLVLVQKRRALGLVRLLHRLESRLLLHCRLRGRFLWALGQSGIFVLK
mmetsp:Transcript_64117/g.144617  ORF Transcript_64117/g.144617 Transcript_64117/m.144617 type:complete len:387 (+) Transcript_64117:762-1922(+)